MKREVFDFKHSFIISNNNLNIFNINIKYKKMKCNFIHIKLKDKNNNNLNNNKILVLFKLSLGNNIYKLNCNKNRKETSNKNLEISYYKNFIKSKNDI